MKQNSIKELPKLNTENLENIFSVHQAETGHYYYNLLETIKFPETLPNNFFKQYSISPEDTWPYISYKMYNTPNLWWIILLANNIYNPLEPLEVSKTLRIPIDSVVRQILAETTRL